MTSLNFELTSVTVQSLTVFYGGDGGGDDSVLLVAAQ
jgi:hypothetical protein